MPALLFAGLLANSFAVAAELSDIEARGKQIYVQGTSPAGNPISAFLGVDLTELPASAAPCASCHGIDGRGRPEGGIVPPDITWTELSKTYGHEHDFGRKHPAFDEASLAAAVIGGVDPAGNKLAVVMPRFRMQAEDMEALIAYLHRVESDWDPGVSARAVRVGVLLPLSGPLAPQGDAVRAVLTGFFQSLNASGGVNGRQVDLTIIPLGASPGQTLANVREALSNSGVFAFVASFVPDVDSELAAMMEDLEIPVIGPITPTPARKQERLRRAYYLYAGREELIRSLSQFATGSGGEEARHQVVVGPDSALLSTVAAGLAAVGDEPAASMPYAESGFSATAKQLRETDDVFFLGSSAELDEFFNSLEESGTAPRVFLPAATVTPGLLNAPVVFDGRIFIAYPTLPADVSESGRKAYAALGSTGTLPGAHFASQISALAAGKILVEALQRAGHALNRERLIAELEGMYDFETGLTPPISFNLNRRIGALGAHIVTVDLAAGRIVPATGWVTLP